MKARRALLLAGSLWEIVRFFLQISILAGLFRGAAGPWVLPWLLFGGAGNLVVAAGGIMLSLFPRRYAGTIALLRVGKILMIFSFLLLLVSGALRAGALRHAFTLGAMAVSLSPILLALFALDILFLSVLLAWKRDDDEQGGVPTGGGHEQPTYSETEASDFH
jgi:hypothetical protein